jgi:methionine-rich copper-binding protein CopC
MRLARPLLALIFLLIAPQSALAHTSVIDTTPLYKSTLTSMPSEISIRFTDQLMTIGDNPVNKISVSAPDSQEVSIVKTTVAGNLLSVTLGDDSYIDGTYIVSYRVVSADGHVISGSYDLYLNKPGRTSPVATDQPTIEHSSFFHVHQTHIAWAGAILILIILWAIYRRFDGGDE